MPRKKPIYKDIQTSNKLDTEELLYETLTKAESLLQDKYFAFWLCIQNISAKTRQISRYSEN